MFLDIILVALYLLFPLLLLLFIRLMGSPLNHLSVPGFVVLSFLVFSYIGYLHLYFGLDDYRVQVGVTDKWLILKSALFSVYSFTTFVIGWGLCMKVAGVSNCMPQRLHDIRPIKMGETAWLAFLMLVVFIVLAKYLAQVPELALFVAISDNVFDAKLVRSDMGNNFSGKYHWYSLFMHEISSFVTFSLFCGWLTSRGKLVAILFWLSFMQSAFAAVMATQKGPIIWLLIGLFSTYVFSKKQGVIGFKQAAYIMLLGMGVVLLVDILFMGSGGVTKALLSVLSRTFSGGISPSYFYLQYFPEHENFLLGRSFPNPGGILPFETYHLTIELANWAFPHLADTGIISTMPAVFWGELYANFGVWGVVALPVIIGFGITLFVLIMNKLRTSPLTIGWTVWLMLHYKDLSITGVSGFIFDIRLFVMVFLLLSVLATTNRLKIELNKAT